MDYKKYSLENLENWLHDALSCGDASPHEIYSVIRKVVQDEYNYHKKQSQKCLGVLELMSGHRPVKLECDKDDPSPECKGAWESFWESYYPEESQQYTEEELNAMCDKAELDAEVERIRQEGGYEWTPQVSKNKWILPVEETKDYDTDEIEYFVAFPQDLLDAANLLEGDEIEWIDNKDGSYTIRKSTKPLGPDEC